MAVRRARFASSEPSAAKRIFVGKILISYPFLRSLDNLHLLTTTSSFTSAEPRDLATRFSCGNPLFSGASAARPARALKDPGFAQEGPGCAVACSPSPWISRLQQLA